jgi:glycosyltransferase involved in cell wall biosynthesis
MNSAVRDPVSLLLTVRELHHGGIERDVAKIATHLDPSRFKPYVASYQDQGFRHEELACAGIPLLHLPIRSLASTGALSSAFRLYRYLRKHRIRIVHAWDPSAIFTLPVARAAGVPVLISSQLGHRTLLDPRTLRQIRWTDSLVNSVVVNCEAMRRHLVEDENISPDRIELCYNGVDTAEFFPLPQAPRPAPLANAKFVIGTVCVLRPEKAVDVLQDAFSRIRLQHPEIRLLIVGSGPERERLLANSKRLGIDDTSIFVPATNDVAAYLRAMDIFVLSSRAEAFSNALLEAMACGCCTVASHVGGTPELVGENRGLLFLPDNSTDLAEKLSRLISSPALRRSLGTAAAAFARQHLTIQEAACRMGAIYERLLARKSGEMNQRSAHAQPQAP